MEEGHVRGERAEIIRAEVEDLKFGQHSQVLQVARRGLIIGKMESVQVGEAAHDELQIVNRVVLHVYLLKRDQVHKLMHLDSVVGDV